MFCIHKAYIVLFFTLKTFELVCHINEICPEVYLNYVVRTNTCGRAVCYILLMTSHIGCVLIKHTHVLVWDMVITTPDAWCTPTRVCCRYASFGLWPVPGTTLNCGRFGLKPSDTCPGLEHDCRHAECLVQRLKKVIRCCAYCLYTF